MEDILAISCENISWHSSLETDNDEHYLAAYEHSTSRNYPKTFGSQAERGPINDLLSIEGSRGGSTESVHANGALIDFGVHQSLGLFMA